MMIREAADHIRPGDFAIERSETHGVIRLSVTGELDLATASRLREASTREHGSPARLVLLDLSAVTFMDSSGLHALIDANRALRSRLRVVLSPAAARVVDVAGIRSALPIIDAGDISGILRNHNAAVRHVLSRGPRADSQLSR